MELIGIKTPILQKGDDLAEIICSHSAICDGDILAVSSKALATVESAHIYLDEIDVSDKAKELSSEFLHPEFCQAVLDECDRLNGCVVGGCPEALLTRVKPEGLEGSILIANAGLDNSNCEQRCVLGWPLDPVSSMTNLHKEIEERSGVKIGVIVTDSCCVPRRQGVSALALSVSGFSPLESLKDQEDLFGEPLKMTREAIADQLATAANLVMGNANQAIPAVLLRGTGLKLSDYCGYVPTIDSGEDLFSCILQA